MQLPHVAALGCAVVLAARPVTATSPPLDSLRLTLVAPDSVRAGDPVPIVLRLTNVTDRPVEAHFLGREIAFDIVVASEDGTILWRRLERAVVPGILQVRVLAPGQTLELKDAWRQRTSGGEPAPPGRYTVWGVLPSDAREPLRTPPTHLRIRPR